MAELENQKVLRITNQNGTKEAPAFITEDVVEVRRAKMIYYKWVSRFMTLLAVGALLYNVAATLAILKLVPEIMIDPQIYVELSDSQSVVRREHINHKMESREKIMVNFIKQYVELRNTFLKDEAEMQKRWLWGGLVSYLSTYKVYQDFAEVYPKLTDELIRTGASRSVEILSVGRTGGEQSSVWKVDFKTYDFSYKNEGFGNAKTVEPIIVERYWTANVRGLIDPNRRIAYRRLINPLGFVVVSYSQSEIIP